MRFRRRRSSRYKVCDHCWILNETYNNSFCEIDATYLTNLINKDSDDGTVVFAIGGGFAGC